MADNLNNDHNEETEEAIESEETVQAEESKASTNETQAPAADEFKSKYFYLAAEMDNMKKRFDREKENLLKYGNEKVLSDLVEVVDNLERTVQALHAETDEKILNIVTGINMVREHFMGVLKKHGLETIESVGKSFDPNFHEALAQQPAEGKEDQEILTEYQKGYVLNGRLLRAAKVVVVKN